ncbi:MAG: GtrA family protein [Pseudomonadota bacterium]|jgi:putative flippase GtrA|nr:GtrA family protein [Pseudomonadota bacterium]
MISLLDDRLTDHQRTIGLQLLRFLVTGGFLTLLYAVIYSVVIGTAVPVSAARHAQLANFAGYLVAMLLGYTLHSRFSFQGHGTRDNVRRTTFRFFIVSLVSFGLNAFWTWLIATRLGLEKHLPLIPISFITPLATFTLNRKWVFA